jgi:hypothetical protein
VAGVHSDEAPAGGVPVESTRLCAPDNDSLIFRLPRPVILAHRLANLFAEALDGIPAETPREETAMTTLYAFVSMMFAALAVGIPLVGVRLIEAKLR